MNKRRTRHRHLPQGGAQSSPLARGGTLRQGSLLLEAMIAIGVFSIFLGGIGVALLAGKHSTIASGDRTRATYLAEQQLEVVRQMRQDDFAGIAGGQHGIVLDAGNWAFSGTSVTVENFESSVTVTSLDADWLSIRSMVAWNLGKGRSGSVVLNTYLTDWRKSAIIGNWSAISRENITTVGGGLELQDIAMAGDYLYITSTTLGGGKGLYVYDISTPTSPVRTALSFDLGASAYGVSAVGNRLYLATDNPSAEVQVYDISSPTTLSLGNLVNSYDLPGSATAQSIEVYDANVFVGTLDNPPHNQFYSLLMSESSPLVELDAFSVTGSIVDMHLRDGYAYLATSNNAAELQVIDVFDPSTLQYAQGIGIDLTNVHDGTAIMTSGTSALIGRVDGASISELTLYDIQDAAVPTPPPGPWTLEIGGDVYAIAAIPGSDYAFVAGNADAAQIKTLNLAVFAAGGSPVVGAFDVEAAVQGILYDLVRDHLYGITHDSLMVFSPG